MNTSVGSLHLRFVTEPNKIVYCLQVVKVDSHLNFSSGSSLIWMWHPICEVCRGIFIIDIVSGQENIKLFKSLNIIYSRWGGLLYGL